MISAAGKVRVPLPAVREDAKNRPMIFTGRFLLLMELCAHAAFLQAAARA